MRTNQKYLILADSLEPMDKDLLVGANVVANQTKASQRANDKHLLNMQHRNQSKTPFNNQHQNGVNKNKKLFPKKLWDLINDQKYNFCLRWSQDGQMVYLNREHFEDSYLKTSQNQFHTQKAISFVRQMNMYGFRKVDDQFYQNDNFKRDAEHLLRNMIRKHPNKTQSGQLSSFALYRSDATTKPKVAKTSSSTSLLHSVSNSNSLDCRPTNKAYSIYSDSHTFDARNDTKGASDQAGDEDSLSSSSGDHCCSGELQHFYPDQREFINLLAAQQYQMQQSPVNTQPARDLPFNQLYLQQEYNNLNAFYAMLIGQLGDHNNNVQGAQQDSSLFDTNGFSSIQQIYQNVLGQTNQFVTPIERHVSSAMTVPDAFLKKQSANSSNGTPETSLLVRDKLQLSGTKADKIENGTKSNDKIIDGNKDNYTYEIEMAAKRRDSKTNRSFKRSVDSILDSNNNQARNEANDCKKIKLNYEGVDLARDLVAQIANSKMARVDLDVIAETSKLCIQFVSTLFDTAQVIARHSNGCDVSENRPKTSDKELKDERPDINLNDLNSALKLLPTKFLKLLK